MSDLDGVVIFLCGCLMYFGYMLLAWALYNVSIYWLCALIGASLILTGHTLIREIAKSANE